MDKKTFTIHVSAYFAADIQIEAADLDEARAIADGYDFEHTQFECVDITDIDVTEG